MIMPACYLRHAAYITDSHLHSLFTPVYLSCIKRPARRLGAG
jgi:hypothetical protein